MDVKHETANAQGEWSIVSCQCCKCHSLALLITDYSFFGYPSRLTFDVSRFSIDT